MLLSGGLDSATCLAIASQDYEVHALTIDYGSKHSRELDSARNLANYFEVASHRILKVDLNAIGGSSLTDEKVLLDTGKDLNEIGKEIPSSYVPARNMTFLSLAIGLAEVVDAECIFIGANAVDYSGYPDCRLEFIESFQKTAELGTKAGVEGGKPFVIHAPLLRMSKKEIILKGIKLGVDYGATHSCYDPDNQGLACGTCDSCKLRLKGFAEAGLVDPVAYQEGVKSNDS